VSVCYPDICDVVCFIFEDRCSLHVLTHGLGDFVDLGVLFSGDVSC